MHKEKREIVRSFWKHYTCLCFRPNKKIHPEVDNERIENNSYCCSLFYFYGYCKHNK